MPLAVAGESSRQGFLMEITAAAAHEALRHGYALVLVPPSSEERLPLEHLDIDGVIVSEPVEHDPAISQLRQRGVEVVTIGREPGADNPPPHVDPRGVEGCHLLLEHLSQQGARRIGLILGHGRRHSTVEFEETYTRWAKDHQRPMMIVTADELGGEQAGRDAAVRLLTEHPEVDAICAPVDAFAVGALDALAEAGRRVPEDVMVVTRYNGVRARMSNPPLTALDHHLDELGTLAINLLLDRLSGRDGDGVVLGPSPSLVPRGSSVRE
jgi:DNA-binding LacI/PurR family transcriptional regulator